MIERNPAHNALYNTRKRRTHDKKTIKKNTETETETETKHQTNKQKKNDTETETNQKQFQYRKENKKKEKAKTETGQKKKSSGFERTSECLVCDLQALLVEAALLLRVLHE
jgi:hypothetical protein